VETPSRDDRGERPEEDPNPRRASSPSAGLTASWCGNGHIPGSKALNSIRPDRLHVGKTVEMDVAFATLPQQSGGASSSRREAGLRAGFAIGRTDNDRRA
jgi:hypothetical protein